MNVTLTESGLLKLKTLVSLMKNKDTDLFFIEAKEGKLNAYYYAMMDGMALKIPVEGLVHEEGLIGGDKNLVDIITKAGRDQVNIKETAKRYVVKGRHKYQVNKHDFALESFNNIQEILDASQAQEIVTFSPDYIPRLAKVMALAHQYTDRNAASKMHALALVTINNKLFVCGGTPNFFLFYKTEYTGNGQVLIPYDGASTTIKVLTSFAPTTIKADERRFFLVDEDFIFAAPQAALDYPNVERLVDNVSHRETFAIELTVTRDALVDIGEAIKPTVKYDSQIPVRLIGEQINYDTGESEVEITVKREFIEDPEEIDFSSRLEYDLIDPKKPFASRVIPFEPIYRFAKFFKKDVNLSFALQEADCLSPFNKVSYLTEREELTLVVSSIKAPSDSKYQEKEDEKEQNTNSNAGSDDAFGDVPVDAGVGSGATDRQNDNNDSAEF